MEYYPAIKKKNEIMPFAETWMDFEIIIAKVNKLEKHKQHMISLMWNLKKKKPWYKLTYLQNTNRLTDIENKVMVTKEE